MSKNDYMSTDNLEKGYWQLCLNPKNEKYISVSLDGKYYVANVLILGICDAVFAFTKLDCPVVRFLTSCGLNVLVYIDIIICHMSEALAIKSRIF